MRKSLILREAKILAGSQIGDVMSQLLRKEIVDLRESKRVRRRVCANYKLCGGDGD